MMIMSSAACASKPQLTVPDGSVRIAINKTQPKPKPETLPVSTQNIEENTIPKRNPVEGKTIKIEWKVDSTLTLQQNINAWAKSSGWVEPVWLATEEYRQQETTYIEGEFPWVLKQVAENSGLNICVTLKPQGIKITNHNIPCKEIQ